MKLLICGLSNESNSFSPIVTNEASFRAAVWYEGDATRHPPNYSTEPLIVWRQLSEKAGVEVYEGFFAGAEPGGVIPKSDYEGLRGRILADAKAVMPIDIILLNLHGSMLAQGYNDCEGDLLSRLRAIVGNKTIIGAELDLHCSITPEMMGAADAILTFKEYPHIDAKERAAELFDICLSAARGETRPVMAVTDTRMIGIWWTKDEPTKSFVARMQDLEGTDGILSVSFAHGFPWADVPEGAAKTLVIADGDTAKAQNLSATLAREIWDMREDSIPQVLEVDQALVLSANAGPGPAVLADGSDNPGGGSPSDSTYLVRAILDRGITNFAAGYFWDPAVVEQCFQAGEGANIDISLGGHFGSFSSEPLLINVWIMALNQDATQSFGSSINSIGRAVWLRMYKDTDLLVNDRRGQVLHPDGFTQLGISLADKDLVIVKSSQHFRAGFEPIASKIFSVSTPGTLSADLAAIPYTNRPRPYWPLDAEL